MIQPQTCGGRGSFDHLVRFYDHNDDLADVVVTHLSSALSAAEAVIVIATEEHRQAFQAGLSRLQSDVRAAERSGRLVWLDAALTLSRFTHDGVIDAAGFDRTVGTTVRELAAAGRPVCAYGEMVALLWEAGNVPGAIELEKLWNGLAHEVAFSLLCAYPSHLMQPAEALSGFTEVCDAHTQVAGGAPAAPDAEIVRRFPPSLAAPRHARRFVAESLTRWHRPELIDSAELVVSELTTNAVQHAGADFTVGLKQADAAIVITVGDPHPDPPRPRPAPATDAGGRGLAILAAASLRWGHRAVPGGKLVWAELTARDNGDGA